MNVSERVVCVFEGDDQVTVAGTTNANRSHILIGGPGADSFAAREASSFPSAHV
ncbi:MAG: hypothetical protein LBL73_12375 [Synergistaceae bacterium]|nr:hypothetical protein [Synergistaceae bacterium]